MLDSCQLVDRYRLQKSLRRIEAGALSDEERGAALAKLQAEIEASQLACDKRRAAIPLSINYPEELPVSARAKEIGELIRVQCLPAKMIEHFARKK